MARSGVTCNAVAPFAATRVTDSIRPANEEQSHYKERALKIAPRFVGGFVAFLCGNDASGITGQLFAVRGREVFLFAQPRPCERFVVPEGDAGTTQLGGLFREHFSAKLSELTTDLEAFNTEPFV